MNDLNNSSTLLIIVALICAFYNYLITYIYVHIPVESKSIHVSDSCLMLDYVPL